MKPLPVEMACLLGIQNELQAVWGAISHCPSPHVQRPWKAGVGSRVWAVISDTVAHHRQKDKQHLCKAHPEKVLVGRVAKIMEFLSI